MDIETGTAPDKSEYIFDTNEATFMADVIEASRTHPVIVDFWAPWCGPCRQLMPALEKAVAAEGGAVRLAKVNIDNNQQIAAQLRVQSVPTVYAFVDGQPVDGFQGAQPESELKKFIGKLTGGVDIAAEAAALAARARDSLAAGDAGGAAQDFAAALQMDPECAEALAGLGRLYMDSGQADEARSMLANAPESMKGHQEIKSLQAALDLLGSGDDPDPAIAVNDGMAALETQVQANPDDLDARLNLAKMLAKAGRNGDAAEHLLYSIEKNRAHDDEAARKFLLTIFEAEGVESEIAIEGRKRLSSILFA